MKRIGLMGGTFDPIHYGHLVTAEAARVKFSLEQVIFIPAGHPPHKGERKIAPPEERLMLTLLATVTNPHFTISDLEIKREGTSYTYDTVNAFSQLLGPEVEIFFITGADAILEIMHWKKIDDLLQLCAFIAATRPGYSLDAEMSKLSMPKALKDKIHLLEIPALAISSTDVRRRVRENESIKYLLPEAVETYILKKQLYQDED